MAKGPLGNSPRDLRDDFVGEPSELYKGGEPPKKSRGPKRVTSNTFHTTVTGETSNKRPDRAGHFRSGGFVRSKQDGGRVSDEELIRSPKRPVPMPRVDVESEKKKSGGRVEGGKPSDRSMPSTTSEKYKSGGRLSMAQRKALPSKSFALPGKGKGPSGKGAGSYPIPDRSHAANALSRVSQHGSSSEKAKVRAKVHAKYPDMGEK